jgi:PiT family inorganic phosphate transporter
MLTIGLLLSTLFLAYNNGANDNFKGVATLYGSGVLSYKSAISLATIATFIGSVCAIFFAQKLVSSFSGKGLIPDEIAGTLHFVIAVGIGAGVTILAATRLGFPISTTHSLVGGLLGAGIIAAGQEVNFLNLGETFLIPLLVSPFIAFALSFIVYRFFNRCRITLGLTKESCICIGETKDYVPISSLASEDMTYRQVNATSSIQFDPQVTVASTSECVDLYTDRVWGITVQRILDFGHVISGAAVSFARGLNDTPKIAGLLLAVAVLDLKINYVLIALAMAIGGILSARRVATTMSKKISEISHGQGFSANLVTSFLVIIASNFGVPVSTTHVSVGAIFGIGVQGQNQNTRVIRSIILSWVITLPVAALTSALAYLLIV